MERGHKPPFSFMSVQIVPIAGTDMRFVPGDWPMPVAMRAEVPEAWARMLAKNSHIWDGRILGFTPPEIGADGILRCEAREDAYSAFLTWREAGFPPIGVFHIFGTALIVSSDNALVMGVMGGQTANAGRVYPPGGSLEPRDVRPDGVVDADACIATELWEETGLRVDEARIGARLAIIEAPRLSIARVFRFDEPAGTLIARIRANLDRQDERELADVVPCWTPEDGRAAGDLTGYAAEILDRLSSGRLIL